MKATSKHQRIKAFRERFIRVFGAAKIDYKELKRQLNQDYLHPSDAILHNSVTWKWVSHGYIPSEERLMALMEWIQDHDKKNKTIKQ